VPRPKKNPGPRPEAKGPSIYTVAFAMPSLSPASQPGPSIIGKTVLTVNAHLYRGELRTGRIGPSLSSLTLPPTALTIGVELSITRGSRHWSIASVSSVPSISSVSSVPDFRGIRPPGDPCPLPCRPRKETRAQRFPRGPNPGSSKHRHCPITHGVRSIRRREAGDATSCSHGRT